MLHVHDAVCYALKLPPVAECQPSDYVHRHAVMPVHFAAMYEFSKGLAVPNEAENPSGLYRRAFRSAPQARPV